MGKMYDVGRVDVGRVRRDLDLRQRMIDLTNGRYRLESESVPPVRPDLTIPLSPEEEMINKARKRERQLDKAPPAGEPVISVPLIKDAGYIQYLFNAISSAISVFKQQHEAIPDVFEFSGRLGVEIVDIINEQGWDFSKFNITQNKNHPVDLLVIKCSKQLTKTIDNQFGSGSIDGKTMEGIPSNAAAANIIASQIGFGYKTEKTIDPSITLKLIR